MAAIFAYLAATGLVFAVAVGAQELLNADWAREFLTFAESEDSDMFPTSPGANLVLLYSIGFPFWCAAIAARWVHRRRLVSLVAPLRGFRWRLVGRVLVLDITLKLALAGLTLLASDEVTFTGFGLRHLIWAAPVVVATLVQTTGEDVFFKGYLLQQLGAVTKVGWLAPLLITSVFALGHVGNSDIQKDIIFVMILFASSELVIIYLLIRTAGMEVPFVLHWTNNIVIFLLIAEADTQANDLTLWVTAAPSEDATPLLTNIVSSAVYFGYMGVLALGLLWPRSPFYVGPRPVIDPPTDMSKPDQATFAQPTAST